MRRREQPRLEPADERGERQTGDGREHRAGQAQPRRERAGRTDRLAGQHGGEHPRQGVAEPAALDHPRPLGGAEQREQREAERPRQRGGEERGGAPLWSHDAKDDARTTEAAHGRL